MKKTKPKSDCNRLMESGSRFLGSGLGYEKSGFDIYEKISLKGSPKHLATQFKKKEIK